MPVIRLTARFSLRRMHAQQGLFALRLTSLFVVLRAHGSSALASIPSSKWNCEVRSIPLRPQLARITWAVRRSLSSQLA